MEYILIINAIIFLLFIFGTLAGGNVTITGIIICVWFSIMCIANIIAALDVMGYMIRVVQ